jgi:hypothetical protein
LPPESGTRPEAGDDERARTRLTIALLTSVAVVQLAGMLSRGLPGPADIAMHSVVVLPAAGFAIGLWRGLRLRIGIVAFALLWSALSIWAAVEITRFATTYAERYAAPQPGLAVALKPISPWFARVVGARSLCFTSAVLALVTGQPTTARRRAGAVLGVLFLVLFVIEHVYQRG